MQNELVKDLVLYVPRIDYVLQRKIDYKLRIIYFRWYIVDRSKIFSRNYYERDLALLDLFSRLKSKKQDDSNIR